MLGVDDLLDICVDALTRSPDDPVAQPLFAARPAGERLDLLFQEEPLIVRWAAEDGVLRIERGTGAVFEIEGSGRYALIVAEVDE